VLRRLAPVLAVALGVSLSAGCADDVAPAARVGDRTITHDELIAEVEEWAGNDRSPRATELATSASPAGYPITPVGGILQERILLEILEPAFDELGLELTPDAREQALGLLGVEPGQEAVLFEAFSTEYIDDYLESYAKGIAVQAELGEEAFLDLLQERARDVEVNPRYGGWDAEQLTVLPPEGPRPAPAPIVAPVL